MKRKPAPKREQPVKLPFREHPDVALLLPGGMSLQANIELLTKLGFTLGVRHKNAPQLKQEFWAEDDRFYHASDNTWWRFDRVTQTLVRAEPPKVAQ